MDASYRNCRRVTGGLGAAVSAATLGSWPGRTRAAAAKTITVLDRQGYGTELSIGLEQFAAATGIDVKQDDDDSEPEMPTRIRTNSGAHDVVPTDSARDLDAMTAGLIDPVDLGEVQPDDLSELQVMGALPDDRRQALNDLREEVKAVDAQP